MTERRTDATAGRGQIFKAGNGPHLLADVAYRLETWEWSNPRVSRVTSSLRGQLAISDEDGALLYTSGPLDLQLEGGGWATIFSTSSLGTFRVKGAIREERGE